MMFRDALLDGVSQLIPPAYAACISGLDIKPLKTRSQYKKAVVGNSVVYSISGTIPVSWCYPNGLSFFLCHGFDTRLSIPLGDSDDASSYKIVDLHAPDAQALLVRRLDACGGTDSFGCCSRYLACSDAGHCVHPNIFRAQCCMYKKNLDAGKIFYGENAHA